MRNSTLNKRILWINSLGSLFSYMGGNQMLKAISVCLEEDKDENQYYAFELQNNDWELPNLKIPCNLCKLEIYIDEFGNKFHRELETKNFLFFCNREEGDENANVIMFVKETMELKSDNYFANVGFNEALAGEEDDPINWMSDYLKKTIETYPEVSEDTLHFHEHYEKIEQLLNLKVNPSEEESSIIKGFLKDTKHLNHKCDFLAEVKNTFSLEYTEAMGETETEFIITDIEYDTDGEDVDLPKEITVRVCHIEYPTYEEIQQCLSDAISDKTGFCHFGFATSPEIEDAMNEKSWVS